MATDAMLTTIDNPYDPFDEYQLWFGFDSRKGYNTPGMLARIAVVSDELSPSDLRAAIEAAIDEIVAENVSGLYVKVTREIKEVPETSESE